MNKYIRLGNLRTAPGAPLRRKNDRLVLFSKKNNSRLERQAQSLLFRLLHLCDDDDDDLATVEAVSASPGSRIRSACRILGLDILNEAWQKLNGNHEAYEARKIAIRKDSLVSVLAGTIHLLPASVAIVIGLLNSFGYYIGEELAGPNGQDNEKFAGLQLAAKLHELTIQASISAMLLQYIRHQLASSQGLPFGALFAGQLYKDISFLWSSEFWGTANGYFSNRKQKWRLIVLLVVCAILGLTVGPASANILRPRVGSWAAGGTDFWSDVPPEALWSVDVTQDAVPSSCAVDTNDRSCPSGQTLAQDYLPYWSHLEKRGNLPGIVRIPGLKSIRELYPQNRAPSQQYSLPFTVATTQYSTVADAVAETGRLWAWAVAAAWRSRPQRWRFWSHTEATFTVSGYQPIVHARCSNFSLSSMDHSTNETAFYDLSDFKAFQLTGDFPVKASPTAVLNHSIASSTGFGIEWIRITQMKAERTALAAVVRVPDIDNSGTHVFPCTIDARIAPAKVQGTRNTYEVITSHVENSTTWWPAGSQASYGASDSWPPINIDPGWAVYLNPILGSGKSTVFQLMAASAGIQDSSALRGPDRGYAVESILTLMVANGLARTNFNKSIIGELDGWDLDSESPTCGKWYNQMMPLHGSMGSGGSIYSVNATMQNEATKLTMYAEVSGYAYSPKGFTTVLSIGILLLYSCIAFSHWGYMIWVRESSDSWQSSAEIAALAMNSHPTHLLQNTGAGVETSRTFKHRVRVVSVGGRVELSFIGRPNEEGIAFNVWYS